MTEPCCDDFSGLVIDSLDSDTAVKGILNRLTPRQRVAVALRYERLSFPEIGRRMGVTHQAAQSLVRRARQTLQFG